MSKPPLWHQEPQLELILSDESRFFTDSKSMPRCPACGAYPRLHRLRISGGTCLWKVACSIKDCGCETDLGDSPGLVRKRWKAICALSRP
jgi:hypothetical protein